MTAGNTFKTFFIFIIMKKIRSPVKNGENAVILITKVYILGRCFFFLQFSTIVNPLKKNKNIKYFFRRNRSFRNGVFFSKEAY